MTDSPESVSSEQTVNMTHSSQNEISDILIKVSDYCDIRKSTVFKVTPLKKKSLDSSCAAERPF